MISGNCFWGEMKQILYFLFGFFISVFCCLQYVRAEDCSGGIDGQAVVSQIEASANSIGCTCIHFLGFKSFSDYTANGLPSWSSLSNLCSPGANPSYKSYGLEYNGLTYTVRTFQGSAGFNYWVILPDGVDCGISDSDGDGLPDDCDLYPDDPTSYSLKMTSYQTSNNTSSGDKTYVCYVTDRGDRFCSGTDGVLNGATDFVVADGTWIAGSDLCNSGSSTPFSPAPPSVVPDPLDPDAPSTPGADGDSDSDLLEKIATNTDSTNKNLDYLADYLGITNDLLGQISNKLDSLGGSVFYAPTADQIGQAVKDNLIDPTQTIDTTVTDNIPGLDETETLTAIKARYSDRYDLFINTLKDSDLFTVPFAIFTGPSGSGSSIQTVEIGAWGQSSNQTATIDFSEYDNVWNILSAVLLMLTSFACFKILVLKKA